MIFALAGNQNCGKTTLFNDLTGSNQHVGNFPGVTVDQKAGVIKGTDHQVVDLPGIYSIRPYTQEEIVTRDFILKSRPDAIINIVDATNIERNLYLTLQLLTLQVSTVIALNMMDELVGNGGSVDVQKMSEALGVPVVPISAAKNQGITELVDTLIDTASRRVTPKVQDFCPEGPVHRCIHAVCHIIEDHAQRINIARRFCAMKLIEGEQDFFDALELSQNEKELIEHTVIEMEHETGLDRNAALADMRYNFIEKVCGECVVKAKESREHRRSMQIDKVLTHRIFAIPLFIAIMGLVFFLTFNVVGAFLSNVMSYAIDGLTLLADRALTAYGIYAYNFKFKKAAFALILSLCPKFGAVINTIPAGVLGGVTTLLYGMIGMIGIRIWVENKVNFDKPLNIMVAAITMIIAIGQFAFTVGGISFNGIAIGTIVILVAYHGLKAIGKATGTIAKDDPDIL